MLVRRIEAPLVELASRLTARPADPFGMHGVSIAVQLFEGDRVSVCTGTDANGSPLREDSQYCFSSVSKLVVSLLILELVQLGTLSLGDSLGAFLGDLAPELHDVTLTQLLSHRSGITNCLTHDRVTYNHDLTRREVMSACRRVEREMTREVYYSDIGYGLLGQVIEEVWQASLEDVISRRLNERLDTRLNMGQDKSERFVRIDGVNAQFDDPAIEPINSDFWRALRLPWGGVFGTIDDMVRVLLQFTAAGVILEPGLRRMSLQDPDSGLLSGGLRKVEAHMGVAASPSVEWPVCPWGLGPELRGDKAPHWTPPDASPDSFGQVGTSGVMVWCDPHAGRIWAIAGTRGTFSGWLFRYGPRLGRIALESPTRRS